MRWNASSAEASAWGDIEKMGQFQGTMCDVGGTKESNVDAYGYRNTKKRRVSGYVPMRYVLKGAERSARGLRAVL